ncbi:unnamed protein product [Vicia faba]|uniref:Uncharacterized protein n=1 Tax=Vicia faba TaxID=3906 RepID=A0AAV1A3X8_VICFA|nr:unnamed protein product [Vicia faba]
MSSSRIVPEHEDAEAFMEAVKLVLKDKRGKYEEFSKLIIGYMARSVDIGAVKELAIKLFKEHTDLISRFNNFLPPGHEISLALDDEQQVADDEGLVVKDEQKDDEQKGDGDTLAVKDDEQQGHTLAIP